MSDWINLSALAQVLVFGILIGAGLPTLFAVGVRAQVGAAGHEGAQVRRSLAAVSYVCFAIVVAAVSLGVLFVARDFIGHHTGWYILGAEAK